MQTRTARGRSVWVACASMYDCTGIMHSTRLCTVQYLRAVDPKPARTRLLAALPRRSCLRAALTAAKAASSNRSCPHQHTHQVVLSLTLPTAACMRAMDEPSTWLVTCTSRDTMASIRSCSSFLRCRYARHFRCMQHHTHVSNAREDRTAGADASRPYCPPTCRLNDTKELQCALDSTGNKREAWHTWMIRAAA